MRLYHICVCYLSFILFLFHVGDDFRNIFDLFEEMNGVWISFHVVISCDTHSHKETYIINFLSHREKC